MASTKFEVSMEIFKFQGEPDVSVTLTGKSPTELETALKTLETIAKTTTLYDGNSAPEAEKNVPNEPQQAAPVVSSADKKAPPEKPVSRLTPVGAKGLMLLRCPKCKSEFVQFLREPQTTNECRKCGAKIPLDALARFEFTCPACKKVSYGRTNIEDSDVFRVRVAGEFPRQENDVFIPLPLVEKSIMTEWTEPTKPARIDIGCDVARYGDDRTVIGYKVDEKAMFYKRKSGQDLMQTADDIMELGLKLMEKYRFDKAIPIKIDDSGLGGGVTDRLRRVKREQPERFWWMDIIPVYFGQRIHHDFYYDSTTYMMSVVKNLLAPQTPEGAQKPVQLILPNDNDLVGQLSTRKYSMTDDAKIRVESKDAMKKRGMHSPDEADCILLLCLPVKPKRRGDVKK